MTSNARSSYGSPEGIVPAVTEGRAGALPGWLGALRITLTLSGMQFVAMGLTLLRSKIIALLIDPHGVGVVSVVDQLIQVVSQVCALSLSIAPVKFLSRTLHEGVNAVGRIYQALLKTLLISSLVGTGISILVVTLRGEVLGRELAGYKGAVLIALLTVPGMALGGLLGTVLASAKGYGASAFYALMLSMASVIAAYGGIRFAGIPGLYYGNLVVGMAAAVGAIGYLWARLRLAPHTRGFRLRDELRRHPDIVSFSAVFYVLAFAQPLSLLIARYTVLKNLGLVEAGYFQAAFAISSVVTMVLVHAIRLYLWPVANRSIPKIEKFRTANDFQRSCTFLGLCAALPLVLFPREVTILLFSPAFVAVNPYLFVFVIADYLLLGALVYQSVVVGVDDLRNFLSTSLFAHLCLAVLAGILAPYYGLWGVAWALIASRSALLLLTILVLRRRHGFAMPGSLAGLMIYGVLALSLAGLLSRGYTLSASTFLLRLAIFAAFASSAFLFLDNRE